MRSIENIFNTVPLEEKNPIENIHENRFKTYYQNSNTTNRTYLKKIQFLFTKSTKYFRKYPKKYNFSAAR